MTLPSDDKLYEFGALCFDAGKSELRRGDAVIPLAAQCRRVLACLLERPHSYIARDALLRAAWPGTAVSEGSLRQAIWELRRALGSDEDGSDYIESARGQGYRMAVDVRVRAQRTAKVALGVVPLVGREEPLQRLCAALEQTRRGHGRACVLSGPAGVGKTRLARELAHHAERAGVQVWAGAGERDEGAPPLWCWTQMLRAPDEARERALRERCERVAPASYRLLREPWHELQAQSTRGSSALERRFLLLQELTQLFVRSANEQPMLVWLDDVQWADEASLAMFCALASALASAHIFLLATCRTPLERAHQARLRSVMRAAHERIELDGLGPMDVRALVRHHFERPWTDAQMRDVHALSRGNPLFAIELARCHAQPTGVLSARDAVQSLLAQHLSACSAECLQTLQAAAVLGEQFTVTHVARVLGVEPANVLGALDEATAQSYVVEDARPLHYRFQHPLVREAAYTLLAVSQRAVLHGRAGCAIEDAADASAQRCAELSHHFVRAAELGFADKALHYTARAADASFDATAFAQAAALYEQALGCLALSPTATVQQKLTLQLRWGEALRESGAAVDRVNALYADVADEALAHELHELRAEAALGYCGHHASRFTPTFVADGTDKRAASLLDSSLSRLDPSRLSLRAALLGARAFSQLYTTDGERSQADAEQAVALARQHGDDALLARTLFIQLIVLTDPQRVREQLAVADELVQLCRDHGLYGLEQQARLSRAVCQLQRGERALAECDFARIEQLARQLGSPEARDRAAQWPLFQAQWDARIDDAEALARQCGELMGDTVRQRTYLLLRTIATMSWREGPSAAYGAVAEAVLAALPRAQGARCLLVGVRAFQGRRDEALQEFDELARDNFRILPRVQRLAELCSLVNAVDVLGCATRAALLHRELAPYGDRLLFFAIEACPGPPVAIYLCILERVMGRIEHAETWAHRALALANRLQARGYVQLARFELAKLAIMRDRPGDRARARAALREVAAFAREHGAGWLARDCAAQLASVSSEPNVLLG